jgi:exodeoxyribonuclease VII large subunit
MDDKLSLTELQLTIRDALYTSLPGFYWVSAEISEIKENYSGHCYLELVDKHLGDNNIKARARAIIWANRYRMLKPFFENSTGETIKEGLKILIKVTLEYHEVYGLSLIISDIDPAFTIGEMAIRRLQIIRKLEEEGVFGMNKEHFFPFVPRRIAIVSSRNAAGYIDFIKHLQGNTYRYIFYTALFEAVMQGSETSISVINALDQISEKIEFFDVVVIIRGGGSQSDLSWFDNYDIAYHITQFPLPIIIGIGHEKDMSVTDMVANISVKTPTAVADLLINRMMETESRITELANEIVFSSGKVIQMHRNKIEEYRSNLVPLAKMMVSEIKESLYIIKMGLVSFGKDYITRAINFPISQFFRLESATKAVIRDNKLLLAKTITYIATVTNSTLKQKNDQLATANQMLNLIDPENVLKRGFTITSKEGRALKTPYNLNHDDIIQTRFYKGEILSTVTLNEQIKKTKQP